MTDNAQKTFRDLLGRDIKVGDNILHLWTKCDPRGYPIGGEGAINKKIATVIKINEKGIGIEWRDSHDKRIKKKSTIFNTRNRVIVLDGKSLNLHIADIVKDVEEAHDAYKKSMATTRKKLRDNIKLIEEDRNRLYEKNKELQEIIDKFMKNSERFELLDL